MHPGEKCGTLYKLNNGKEVMSQLDVRRISSRCSLSPKDRAAGRGGDPTGVGLETDLPTILVKEFMPVRRSKLRQMIFMALCCDLGIFIKRFISPFTNILTDSLHIPGGIATAFSLMFLVIAVSLMPRFGNGILMGAVQSGIALAMGMVGSMGALAPIGYIVPGLVIDAVFLLTRKTRLSLEVKMLIANALAGMSASLTANVIVFRLWGVVLLLYLSVACTCGAICGLAGAAVTKRLLPIIGKEECYEKP